MRLVNLILVVFVMTFLVACNKNDSESLEVRDFGKYELGDNLTLIVEDNDGIVVYHMQDKSKTYLITENSKASKFQNWAIVYQKGELWFASGDIGCVVWIKNNIGIYEKKDVHSIAPDELDIPPLVAEFLF